MNSVYNHINEHIYQQFRVDNVYYAAYIDMLRLRFTVRVYMNYRASINLIDMVYDPMVFKISLSAHHKRKLLTL